MIYALMDIVLRIGTPVSNKLPNKFDI
uniref:Uncharacterized protein n=1 Tax=Arundo donax TaxID=35708 RepID=A0A0A9E0L2_ARUDO